MEVYSARGNMKSDQTLEAIARLIFMYNGPVKVFDTITNPHWTGETVAKTEKEARRNLAYQYRKQTGRARDAKVTLPAKIQVKEM